MLRFPRMSRSIENRNYRRIFSGNSFPYWGAGCGRSRTPGSCTASLVLLFSWA
jgi:hypothetical protein